MSQTKVYFNRSQWIRFRAEQLALRARPEMFIAAYAARSASFGFEDYNTANQAFRTFLQPYIDEARRAWEAEGKAWYEHTYLHNYGLKTELQALVAHDANVDPFEDDEDEDENDECEKCGAVVGKGDDICNECDAENEAPFEQY